MCFDLREPLIASPGHHLIHSLFDDVDSIGNFPLVTGGLPEQFFQAFDALA